MKLAISGQRKSDLEYFFEVSLDFMAIVGRDGNFKKVSKYCSKALGWNEDEFLEHEWHNFVHKDDLKIILDVISSKNINYGVKGLEFRFRCKDNTYIWIECSYRRR